MCLELVDLKDSIGMVADKTYIFLILDETGTDGNQTVIGAISGFYPLPEFRTWVSFQINFLRQPTSESVEVTRRVTANKFVAPVYFQIGLLEKADPELSLVRITANKVSEAIYRHVIVDLNRSPDTVNEHFDYVFTAWIVNRVAHLVLWIELA